jgi:hypothetical protein
VLHRTLIFSGVRTCKPTEELGGWIYTTHPLVELIIMATVPCSHCRTIVFQQPPWRQLKDSEVDSQQPLIVTVLSGQLKLLKNGTDNRKFHILCHHSCKLFLSLNLHFNLHARSIHKHPDIYTFPIILNLQEGCENLSSWSCFPDT